MDGDTDDDYECSTCDELEITPDILKWCRELQDIYDKLKSEIKKEVLEELNADTL